MTQNRNDILRHAKNFIDKNIIFSNQENKKT